jgi:hypothetical protein
MRTEEAYMVGIKEAKDPLLQLCIEFSVSIL